jgi:hypothetical protein
MMFCSIAGLLMFPSFYPWQLFRKQVSRIERRNLIFTHGWGWKTVF